MRISINPSGGRINSGDYINFTGLPSSTKFSFTVYYIPHSTDITMSGSQNYFGTPPDPPARGDLTLEPIPKSDAIKIDVSQPNELLITFLIAIISIIVIWILLKFFLK